MNASIAEFVRAMPVVRNPGRRAHTRVDADPSVRLDSHQYLVKEDGGCYSEIQLDRRGQKVDSAL